MGGQPGASERERVAALIASCWRTQAIHAAVCVGVPEKLGVPQDSTALAQACGCDADALRRLLRALCALGLCREDEDGRFHLTPGGQLLRREGPDAAPGLRAMALWWGGPMWNLWPALEYSVRTGRSAREMHTGKSHYTFLDGDAPMAALFHEAMQAQSAAVADAVARLPAWQDAQSFVDVGGGNGALAAAVAARHPRLQGVILDRADAQAGACEAVRQRGLESRLRFTVGDFFGALPPGADWYLLKSILHNWDAEACARILARCAEAAAPQGRLLLVERLLPERLQTAEGHEALARADLNMLAGLGGRERTLKQYAQLLQAAGFRLAHVEPLSSEFHALEAVPA